MTEKTSTATSAVAHPGATPDDVAEALAGADGRMGGLARDVVWFAEIASTNDVAARLADAGAVEGTLVGADAQTRGRGRHGHSWVSPPGAGLYVSVILRPTAAVVPLLTLAAGIAVTDGIAAASGLRTGLKWPNDVLALETAGRPPQRKLAGILAEAGVGRGGVQHVIVGIGINVGLATYPPEIATRATSLERELGRRVDRGLLLAECVSALWSRYQELHMGGGARILDAWRRGAQATLGRTVEWEAGDRTQRGVAVDVDVSGALVVRTSEGIAHVSAGEIRWIG